VAVWDDGKVNRPQKFRPVSNVLLAGVVWFLAALLPFNALYVNDFKGFALSLAVSATAATLAWLLFFRPCVLIYPDHLVVVNPLRKVRIGLASVETLETKFSLVIGTDSELVTVWVAPAPSRYAARGLRKADLQGLPIETRAGLRAADSPVGHSGQAAVLIKLAIKQATIDGTELSAGFSAQTNWLGACLIAAGLAAIALLQF